jgi:hypothetical protein
VVDFGEERHLGWRPHGVDAPRGQLQFTQHPLRRVVAREDAPAQRDARYRDVLLRVRVGGTEDLTHTAAAVIL